MASSLCHLRNEKGPLTAMCSGSVHEDSFPTPPGSLDCMAWNRGERPLCDQLEKERCRRSQINLKREIIECPDAQMARAALSCLDVLGISNRVELICQRRGCFGIEEAPPGVHKIISSERNAIAPARRDCVRSRLLSTSKLERQAVGTRKAGAAWNRMSSQIESKLSLVGRGLVMRGQSGHWFRQSRMVLCQSLEQRWNYIKFPPSC